MDSISIPPSVAGPEMLTKKANLALQNLESLESMA